MQINFEMKCPRTERMITAPEQLLRSPSLPLIVAELGLKPKKPFVKLLSICPRSVCHHSPAIYHQDQNNKYTNSGTLLPNQFLLEYLEIIDFLKIDDSYYPKIAKQKTIILGETHQGRSRPHTAHKSYDFFTYRVCHLISKVASCC
jgi:hypothetical protein